MNKTREKKIPARSQNMLAEHGTNDENTEEQGEREFVNSDTAM